MNKFLSIAIISTSLLFAGCAGGPTKEELMKEYKSVSAQAKSSLKAAGKVKNAWRDSGKFLKKADKLAKNKKATKDDLKKAISLAKKVKSQGDMAVMQSKAEKGAKPPKELR